MPILKGAVTFARFKLNGDVPKDVKRWLVKGLTSRAFDPIDPKSDDERTSGFVELENSERSTFAAGDLFFGHAALFGFRVDTLKVKPNELRAQLLQWVQAYEVREKRGPGRREKADQKDLIRKHLRGKMDPSTKVFEVSWDTKTNDVFVWATARTVIEEVQAVLESALTVRLESRVPSAFIQPALLDQVTPTKALFEEVA